MAHSGYTVNASCSYVPNNCILEPLLRLIPKLRQGFKGLVSFMWVHPTSPSQSPFRQMHSPVGSLARRDIDSYSWLTHVSLSQPLSFHSSSRDKRDQSRGQPGGRGLCRQSAITTVQLADFRSLLTFFSSVKYALDPACICYPSGHGTPDNLRGPKTTWSLSMSAGR